MPRRGRQTTRSTAVDLYSPDTAFLLSRNSWLVRHGERVMCPGNRDPSTVTGNVPLTFPRLLVPGLPTGNGGAVENCVRAPRRAGMAVAQPALWATINASPSLLFSRGDAETQRKSSDRIDRIGQDSIDPVDLVILSGFFRSPFPRSLRLCARTTGVSPFPRCPSGSLCLIIDNWTTDVHISA